MRTVSKTSPAYLQCSELSAHSAEGRLQLLAARLGAARSAALLAHVALELLHQGQQLAVALGQLTLAESVLCPLLLQAQHFPLQLCHLAVGHRLRDGCTLHLLLCSGEPLAERLHPVALDHSVLLRLLQLALQALVLGLRLCHSLLSCIVRLLQLLSCCCSMSCRYLDAVHLCLQLLHLRLSLSEAIAALLQLGALGCYLAVGSAQISLPTNQYEQSQSKG